MSDFTSPNTGNYSIPKANVYFTPVGGERRHMGNIPGAQMDQEITRLEHYSAMAGTRIRDFTAVTSKAANITLTFEEMTRQNMQLALLGGDLEEDPNSTEGEDSFLIGAADAITGRLEIIATNDIGPKWNFDFPSVTFIPEGAVDFITDGEDAVAAIEISAEVNASGDPPSFGRATLQGSTHATP